MAVTARRLAIEFADPEKRLKAEWGQTIRSWCAGHPDYQKFGNTAAAHEALRSAVAACPMAHMKCTPAESEAESEGAASDEGESSGDEGDLIGDCLAKGAAGKSARLRWCVRLGRERRDKGELRVFGKGVANIVKQCKENFKAKPHVDTVNPYINTKKEDDVPMEMIGIAAGAPRHMPKEVEGELYKVVQGHRLHSLALTPWDLIALAKLALDGTPAAKLYKTKEGRWKDEKLRRWYLRFVKRCNVLVGARRTLDAQRKKWCTAENFLKSQTIWEDVHVAAGIAVMNENYDEANPASPRVFLKRSELWRSASFDEVHCELGTGEPTRRGRYEKILILGRKEGDFKGDGEAVGNSKSGPHLTGIGGMHLDGDPIRPGLVTSLAEIPSEIYTEGLLPEVCIDGEMTRGYIEPPEPGNNGGVTNESVMRLVERSILYRCAAPS